MEMKMITFEKLLENWEECPPGLKPSYVTDDRKYMQDYVKQARLELANRKPTTYPEPRKVEIEEITDEPPEMERVEKVDGKPQMVDKVIFHEVPEISNKTEQIETIENRIKKQEEHYDERFNDDFNQEETLSTQASEEVLKRPVSTNLIPYEDDQVDFKPEY